MEKQSEGELGKITKHPDGFEVRFERTFNFDRWKVWGAITDPKKLALWFTDIEMDFVVGGRIVIRFRDVEQTESLGKIVRIKAPELFEFSWEDELAKWELFEEGRSKCKLVLTYSKLPDNYAFSVPAGWHVLLDQLGEVLEGRNESYPFGGEETESAQRMKAVYRKIVAERFPELVKTN